MELANKNSFFSESGTPKICVPITGKTTEEILQQAEVITGKTPDLIEWRCDFFTDSDDLTAVKKNLLEIKKLLPSIPVLFTFRTLAEGGNQAMTPQDYERLNRFVLEEALADFIDIEKQLGGAIALAPLLQLAHAQGIQVIGSCHYFSHTPPVDEMVAILTGIKEMGMDIPKLAVMPKNTEDVLHLLEATVLAKRQIGGPVITMSMGTAGLISRISGEIFGSALTFATVGDASAPGQMALTDVAQVLAVIHKYQ